MAERDLFPLQKIDRTSGPSVFRQTGLQSDGRSFSDQKNVPDDPRELTEMKSDILSHRLYEQLLEAHISCICAGLPAEYTRATVAQVANKHNVAMKYLILGRNAASQTMWSNEIDEFMESYLLFLHSIKKQLEDHYVEPASEAMAAYCELEMAFQELTGTSSSSHLVSAPMVHSKVMDGNLEFSMDEFAETLYSIGSHAKMDIEGEISLSSTIREGLKMELKESYLKGITSMREEIIRKRKAGKLLGDISILKHWWNSHSKWPYPTDEEKKQMMEMSGLELGQINNWFINHRKRNWNKINSTAEPSQRKRKRP